MTLIMPEITVAAGAGVALIVVIAVTIMHAAFKAATRGKYRAPSRITWKVRFTIARATHFCSSPTPPDISLVYTNFLNFYRNNQWSS